jgi:hypothetical protein
VTGLKFLMEAIQGLSEGFLELGLARFRADLALLLLRLPDGFIGQFSCARGSRRYLLLEIGLDTANTLPFLSHSLIFLCAKIIGDVTSLPPHSIIVRANGPLLLYSLGEQCSRGIFEKNSPVPEIGSPEVALSHSYHFSAGISLRLNSIPLPKYLRRRYFQDNFGDLSIH